MTLWHNLAQKNWFSFQKCNETHDSWVTWVDWNEWWLMFKMSVILNLNLSVSTEQPKCSDERKCKWREITTPTIVLVTGHFSNSAKFREMLKFRGKGQIPRLGWKFRRSRKTVGPNHQMTKTADDVKRVTPKLHSMRRVVDLFYNLS